VVLRPGLGLGAQVLVIMSGKYLQDLLLIIMGLPDGEEVMTLAFFILIQYRRVTDGQTDGHVALSKTREGIASHG